MQPSPFSILAGFIKCQHYPVPTMNFSEAFLYCRSFPNGRCGYYGPVRFFSAKIHFVLGIARQMALQFFPFSACSQLHVPVLADSVHYLELLSPSEMKEAFALHSKQIRCLIDLPDLRKSVITQQRWRENIDEIWTMCKMCASSCVWASQHDQDRSLVQRLAAGIQARTPSWKPAKTLYSEWRYFASHLIMYIQLSLHDS